MLNLIYWYVFKEKVYRLENQELKIKWEVSYVSVIF